MKKGQMTTEFLTVIFFASIIFLIFSLFIFNEFAGFFVDTTHADAADRIALIITKEIDFAYFYGDGYISNFTLDDGLAGDNYTVYFNETARIIEVDSELGAGVHHFISPRTTILSIGPGLNVVSNRGGDVFVRNYPT